MNSPARSLLKHLLTFLVLSVKLKLTISCFREVLLAFWYLQIGVVLSGAPFNQELTQAVSMTSPSSPGQMHEMLLVPKDLVTIQVGCLSVSVYPKVEPRMPVFERAHTFQVAKSTLEALNTDTCFFLEAMGTRLVFILAGALFYGTVSFRKLTSV
jgi:hypothetical protein